MHKRAAYRVRITFTLLVAVVFALGSSWLVQTMTGGDEPHSDPRHNEPDYIVEGFSTVRMGRDGKPRYIVSGAKLTHRPVDDSAEIERPLVLSLSAGQPLTSMRALRARIDHASSKVHLMGAVDVARAASPTAQAYSFKTEALTILPDEDQMVTDQPLELKLGRAIVMAKGLRANNATRQLSLVGTGQINIAPPDTAR